MFEKIADHVYVYPFERYTDRPNIGLIVGEKYALLFEAGNSANHVEMIKKDLVDQGLPMPDFVAISHWHWDHSFAMSAWECPSIAGKETNEQLKVVQTWKWDDRSMEERIAKREDITFCCEMIKREYEDRDQIKVVPADIVFEERMELDLGGGVVCHLIHAKGPHASDSVICYVPSDKFLFLGDSDCKDLYGLPWHFDIEHEEDFVPVTDALPYDREKVKDYLQILDTLSFTKCISGHAPVMTREVLYSYLKTVL